MRLGSNPHAEGSSFRACFQKKLTYLEINTPFAPTNLIERLNSTSPPPPTPHMNYFSTERLQLAIFIHASGRLHFWGCEPVRPGAVKFVFEDPERMEKQIELEFDRGAPLSATSLFASQKFLRRTMSEALEQTNIGEFNDRYKS
jgi:hypothetical protein